MSTGAAVEESEGCYCCARLPRGSKVMSTDEQDIRRKLKQIEEVVPVLEAMDVPDLPYKQWLEGQDRKNQPLTGANQTELKLKKSQIERLESRGHANEATVLEDEKAELAIMNDKMAKMVELQTALDNALRAQTGGNTSLDQQVADLISEISQDELKLKHQQVASLDDRIKISPADKQSHLQQLREGETYEVGQLEQICPLNQQIAMLVKSQCS